MKNIIRTIDEIKKPEDIIDFWHVSSEVASCVFSVVREVLFNDNLYKTNTSCSHDVILNSNDKYEGGPLYEYDREKEIDESESEDDMDEYETEEDYSSIENFDEADEPFLYE